jgi:hypothetical protein
MPPCGVVVSFWQCLELSSKSVANLVTVYFSRLYVEIAADAFVKLTYTDKIDEISIC